MARVHMLPFELNTLTNGVENNSLITTNNGGLSIQTGTVRTGTYALKVNAPGSSGGDNVQLQLSNSHSQYVRVYLNISAFPTGTDNSFLLIADATNGVVLAYLAIETNGTISLSYGDNSGGNTLVGASSAVSLNTWNMLEIHVDDTAGFSNTVTEARLNGTVFATRTGQIVVTGNGGLPNGFVLFGDQLLGTNTTGVWYMDDIAINDSSGSSQTGYPGVGAITRITPNAAGDANSWATQVGGTAGSANNFTRVNEVTPNDITSYNGSTVLNQQDLFKNGDPAIGTDTVSVVQVMARYRNNTVDLTTAFVIQCEKAAAGTLASGAAIDPDSTTWTTCAPAGSLVLYNDPDGNPWTESTLATMQIGYKISTAHTNAIDITNIWAYVDHAPAAAVAATKAPSMGMMGVGA